MYEITVETHFSAAHRLRHYHGPCENLHGHNWLVRATVRCKTLDERGIGIDFKELKAVLNSVVEKFDHQDLNIVLEQSEINPSSENISRYIFERMREKLTSYPVTLVKIEVFETPGNCAAYYE